MVPDAGGVELVGQGPGLTLGAAGPGGGDHVQDQGHVDGLRILVMPSGVILGQLVGRLGGASCGRPHGRDDASRRV